MKKPLAVPKSALYGLDRWRELLGSPQILNSAYRNPAHNANTSGSAPDSRHMWGDAVDMRNVTQTQEEYKVKACLANYDTLNLNCDKSVPDARADYVEPKDLPNACGLVCVHADWRFHDVRIYNYSQ